MVITDHNIDVKPVIGNFYSETSLAEENPWRLLFHSGTAGVLSNTFCIDRLKSGASYQFLRLNSSAPLLKIASTHNDIDALIEMLKPSMSQIAMAFGVTRQWVYAWKTVKICPRFNLIGWAIYLLQQIIFASLFLCWHTRQQIGS